MRGCGNEYFRRQVGTVLGKEKDIVLPVVMRAVSWQERERAWYKEKNVCW